MLMPTFRAALACTSPPPRWHTLEFGAIIG
jgi:hypothetical protein